MTVKGFIFDFDGLIIDTESADLRSWQDTYAEFRLDFPIHHWIENLGRDPEVFDVHQHFASTAPHGINLDEVFKKRRADKVLRASQTELLPGVLRTLGYAQQNGLRLGMASSSPGSWVITHLQRLGILDRFEIVFTKDDVTHTKPSPELYLKALQALDLQPHEAVVFEDSPNGILAAKTAGIYCVAVRTAYTSYLDVSRADQLVDSLESLALDDLLMQVNSRSPIA